MEIYDQLLRFSLFQGMSHADLMEVVTHTKLGFLKLSTGKYLVKEGDSCTHLSFLTHGSLLCETVSDDGACKVVEYIKAPYIVQPDRLFGLSQRYTSTFKADSHCNFITIDKQEVLLLVGDTAGIPTEPAQHHGDRQSAHASPSMAHSSQESARATGTLLLLTLSLPCWSQDLLRLDETDCRRPERQSSRHQSRPQRHAA